MTGSTAFQVIQRQILELNKKLDILRTAYDAADQNNPNRQVEITVAIGQLHDDVVRLERFIAMFKDGVK